MRSRAGLRRASIGQRAHNLEQEPATISTVASMNIRLRDLSVASCRLCALRSAISSWMRAVVSRCVRSCSEACVRWCMAQRALPGLPPLRLERRRLVEEGEPPFPEQQNKTQEVEHEARDRDPALKHQPPMTRGSLGLHHEAIDGQAAQLEAGADAAVLVEAARTARGRSACRLSARPWTCWPSSRPGARLRAAAMRVLRFLGRASRRRSGSRSLCRLVPPAKRAGFGDAGGAGIEGRCRRVARAQHPASEGRARLPRRVWYRAPGACEVERRRRPRLLQCRRHAQASARCRATRAARG